MPVKKKATKKAKKKEEEAEVIKQDTGLLELNGSQIEEITLVVQWDHYYDEPPYPYTITEELVRILNDNKGQEEFTILRSGYNKLSLKRPEPNKYDAGYNRALVEGGS